MKKLGWFVSLLAVSSCSFPRPADLVLDGGGDGAAGGDSLLEDASAGGSACQLTAIGPSIANTDDPITLEGTFVDTVTVNFPGGTSIAATLLGPHRARVRVPASATAGDLTVSTCGLTLGPLPFRRASFTLGVGAFVTTLEQSAGARQYQNLSTPRASHTSAVIGSHIYVLGGVDRGGSLNNVERALINADGTFGKFSAIPGVTLVTPRQAHTTAVIGNQLYAIGGFSDGSLSSVERATVAQDGSLSPFTTVAGVSLVTARQSHTSAVIGRYLYVIGGLGTSTLNTIERADIHSDGTLGTFATLPDATLSTPRRGHTTVVVGDYLYTIGGTGNNGVLKDIERAAINTDGSLGTSEAAPGTALVLARSGHAAALIGSHLYVFGGVGESGSVNTVERALVNADGSLGAFEAVASSSMLGGRHGHTLALAGNHMYILGGSDDIRFLDFGERATLNASGELGPFGLVPDIALTSERAHCAAAVFGNYLYVVGGASDPTGVERASVTPDGSIGPFAPVPDVSMAQPHDGHTTAVIGNYLYVLGGGTSIERTTIGADGSLAAFETLATPMMGVHSGAASAVIGGYLYVFGGSGSGDASTSVEQAVINSDGSLGKFTYSAGNGVTARTFPIISTIAGSVYLFGGGDPGGFATGVYRAQIASNGALDAFEAASGITLDVHEPIAGPIGGYMYAFGIDGVIQRANLSPQGSPGLGAFITVPDVRLTTNRFAGVSVSLGNYVYVAAGAAGRNPLNTVERAELR